MPPKRTTIVDIARSLGLNHGTVSRALADDPRVSAGTKKRILEAARRLNYQPNLTARAVKSGSTGNLGVFCGGGSWIIHTDYYGRLLAGLTEMAERNSMRIVLYVPKVKASRDDNPTHDEIEFRGIGDLRDGRIDGAVILGGTPPKPRELQELRALGLPIVLLGSNVAMRGFAQVASGARQRTEKAAAALFQRGCRRVGFVGLFEGGDFNAECVRGLRAAAKAAGVRVGGSLIAEIPHWELDDPDQVRVALLRLQSARADALIFAQAEQAFAAEGMAQSLGIDASVPLVSFGQYLGFLRARPTRVELLGAELHSAGSVAFELWREVAAGRPPRTVVIDWQWLERPAAKPATSTRTRPR